MSLLPSEKAQYSVIIDEILASGDLETISAKQIVKSLQNRLEVDISDKRAAVKSLIMERFDAVSSSNAVITTSSAPDPNTNGHFSTTKAEPKVKSEAPQTPDEEGDEDSDAVSPPKKKRKQAKPADDDAKLAAMLQAQENSRARPTRGGNDKKRTVKKAMTKKLKKSADKVKKDDDSDLELNSDGEVKEKVKKGGFHKQYYLSAPLADLVGEPQLSRPQVVKKIWEYIKARDLQDPADKRQIRCDEKLQSVFKQDRVHMFTMNKILSKQLYAVDEAS